MKLTRVRAHILRNRRFNNWKSEVEGRWKFEDLQADEGYRSDWISFDCLAWDKKTRKLYLGLAAVDTDIFYVFEPASAKFSSLGFQRISDPFDVKLHRSLEIDDDGTIYAATALLHDLDRQHEAMGGKLVSYVPAEDRYEILAIPIPPFFIQSILLDRERRIIYGFTYPGEYLFRYDLNTKLCRPLAFIGSGLMMSQPHCASLDQYGRLWSTWGASRAFEYELSSVPIRICCYNPDKDKFTWYQHGFPKIDKADPACIDHMFLASDGFIYAGTVAGGLSRLDPETGNVEYLGKPFPNQRLAGLVEGPDGLIYGAGNEGDDRDGEGAARMFVFDPKTCQIEDLGRIYDENLKAGAVKVHMLVATEDGTLYAGENDNIYRSSYLWECKTAGY